VYTHSTTIPVGTSIKFNYRKGNITETTSSHFFLAVLLQYLHFLLSPSQLATLDSVSKHIPWGSHYRWNRNNQWLTLFVKTETLKECFEKLQITRNEVTVWAATGLLCMMNDKGLNFGLTFFHCTMPHLYTSYNQLPHGNANSTSTFIHQVKVKCAFTYK
jgi:hypothetical protein